MKISIYTDGSCLGNPGKGGWAIFIKEKKQILYGCNIYTTNNRMELYGIFISLQYLYKNQLTATIYTDSTYCQKGISIWMYQWKIKNWMNIKNVDLWKQIYDLNNKMNIEYIHIFRSGNQIADKYARYAAKHQCTITQPVTIE